MRDITYRHLWLLDPAITFLNHGSFGACPITVLQKQQELRSRLERQPVQFMVRDLEGMLDAARSELATFIGAPSEDVAFVPNATTGVNAVLRSLRFEPGDEILVSNHAYAACRNALDHVAARSGARAVTVTLPFPIASPDEVVEPFVNAVGPRTRLALLEHVTSPTGLVLPIERLVRELEQRGVDALVDGAHAPGMLPLEVSSIGAAYYTANCHKWLCAPKGAAFLYVRRDRQEGLHPTTISHGLSSPRQDRSRLLLEFDWTGTHDPTAYLSVPHALRFMGSLLPGGWSELMRRNRQLALEARAKLCAALGAEPPAPESMIGTLVAVPLPDGSAEGPPSPLYVDPLQDELLARHRIEVPIVAWPAPPKRLVRISAQLYNTTDQYERLGAALRELLPL